MQTILPLQPGHPAAAAHPATALQGAARLSRPDRETAHPRDGRAQRRQRSWRHANEGAVERGRWMDVQERRVGDFRIVAGVLGAQDGGYIAAVEVHRIVGAGEAAEAVFSSERVSGGHRFEAAALALRHALDVGHQAVRLHLSMGA